MLVQKVALLETKIDALSHTLRFTDLGRVRENRQNSQKIKILVERVSKAPGEGLT